MKVRLKVCNPSGKTVFASVKYLNGEAEISVPFIEGVKKDNPEFAKNGIINYTVPRHRYQKALKGLTKYLENIFLKELAEDEIIHSSNGGGCNSGRVKKESSAGSNEKFDGKNDNPVCDRGRGKKQSPSDRGRIENSNLVESGDSENGGNSESGNEAIQES